MRISNEHILWKESQGKNMEINHIPLALGKSVTLEVAVSPRTKFPRDGRSNRCAKAKRKELGAASETFSRIMHVLVEFHLLFSQFRQRIGSVHSITALLLFRDSPLISHYFVLTVCSTPCSDELTFCS